MPLLDHKHAGLSECSRMPSPLPVKGNTCIDDPDQSTDQIEDNSIEYHVYVCVYSDKFLRACIY